MGKVGLASETLKPNTSRPAPAHQVFPHLPRGLEITQPIQV